VAQTAEAYKLMEPVGRPLPFQGPPTEHGAGKGVPEPAPTHPGSSAAAELRPLPAVAISAPGARSPHPHQEALTSWPPAKTII
jgi:hypothetical protein